MDNRELFMLINVLTDVQVCWLMCKLKTKRTYLILLYKEKGIVIMLIGNFRWMVITKLSSCCTG